MSVNAQCNIVCCCGWLHASSPLIPQEVATGVPASTAGDEQQCSSFTHTDAQVRVCAECTPTRHEAHMLRAVTLLPTTRIGTDEETKWQDITPTRSPAGQESFAPGSLPICKFGANDKYKCQMGRAPYVVLILTQNPSSSPKPAGSLARQTRGVCDCHTPATAPALQRGPCPHHTTTAALRAKQLLTQYAASCRLHVVINRLSFTRKFTQYAASC